MEKNASSNSSLTTLAKATLPQQPSSQQNLTVKAEVIAKADGIVAGLEEAAILAEYIGLKAEAKAADGEQSQKQTGAIRSSQATPKQSYPSSAPYSTSLSHERYSNQNQHAQRETEEGKG